MHFLERNDYMKKFIEACVSILPKPLRDIYYKYEEKWLYLFFGLLTTAVSFITAGVSKSLLESAGMGSGAVGTVSTTISWVCSVTFAFITNRIWVFDSKAKGAKAVFREGVSFYGGRVFTFFVELIMMGVGYSWLGFNYWVVKTAANVVVLILNYVISKIFVFRNKDAAAVKNENE